MQLIFETKAKVNPQKDPNTIDLQKLKTRFGKQTPKIHVSFKIKISYNRSNANRFIEYLYMSIFNYYFILFIENMGCEPSRSTTQESSIACINRRSIKKFSFKMQSDATGEISENVTPTSQKPSERDLKQLEKALASHFFFYKLKKNQMLHLIDNLQGYSASKNSTIFQKGDIPNLFFFIKQGTVTVDIGDGNDLKILKPGQYFGELALLYKAPRSATIKAQEDCLFFCLQHRIFRKTMQQMTIQNFSKVKSHIEKAPIFKYLTNREKVTIAYNTHTLKYQSHQIIFKEGDDANSFFIITKGRVQIKIPGKDNIIMEAGQSFGENSFQEGAIRSGTAQAIEKVTVLSIGRESLRKCIGGFLQEMSFINIMKWAMTRHSYLKFLNDLQRQKLVAIADIIQYEDGQVIEDPGNVASKVYICLQEKINDEGIGSIHCFEEIFGEEQQRILKSIKKVGKGKVAELEYVKIKKVVGKNLTRTFQQPLQLQQKQDKKKTYYNSICPEKLSIKYQLGSGLFGKVFCVEDHLKIEYALKCIKKQKIIESDMEKFIIFQKKILEEIDSPFIVKLYKTMKNKDYVFFLLKYIDGGDFFKILRNIGLCTRDKARFYLGCLILAIEHLHNRNIIYRDIKPQNTVADKSGFLHLVDLGTSKYLEQSNGYKTFTIVGTPHYMAPEIIHGEGYSFAADLWSMGIFFYQMVCGQLPFGSEAEDPYEVFRQIEESNYLKIPKHYTDNTGINLLEKLLSRDEREREIEDFARIKNMAFFQDFNWQQLQKKTMQSPFTINRQKLNLKIGRNLQSFLKQMDTAQQKKESKQNKEQGEKQNLVSKNREWNDLFE